MSAVQSHIPNGLLNGFSKEENEAPSVTGYAYFPASDTGRDGPDQILASNVDRVWEPNGRVRIKYDVEDKKLAEYVSVPGFLTRAVKAHPDRVAMISRPDADGKRHSYTYKEYEMQVRTVAKAFIKLGLQRYHGVCIIGFNSPEWFISDLAAIYAGGLVTGIYTTNSPEACEYCAKSSRANIIVVEDSKQLAKIMAIKKNLPHLKAIIQYEGIPQEKDVLSWHELMEIGKAESDDKLETVLRSIGANECCTLVYTSGTVGDPKAVMLSHDNLTHDTSLIGESVELVGGKEAEIIVSFLPLSHVAAQVVDIYLSMHVQATVIFANKDALKGSLLETLKYARPTAFLGVPRVWEKIHEKMMAVARNNGPIKTWIANWAKSQGLQYNLNKMNGIDYKSWGYLFAKWLVFNNVKRALGLDRCKIFVSAAAPLSTDIKKYFMSLDIPIVEAYGMSECSGAHTITIAEKNRMGSVGPILRGLGTKILQPDNNGEGEICIQGRHIFMGYLNMPEKTKEVRDECGWLQSGDIGRIESNFLYVTGRIKELIITAGGENIPPVQIEQTLLKELPVLSNAMLIGDMKKYLTILVTLKTEVNADTGEPHDELLSTTISWAISIGSTAKTVTEVINTHDPAIYKAIEQAITRTNDRATSNAQKVQKFTILPHDFSIPTGELGPTLKLKRNFVVKKYANLIEQMYK